MQQENNQQSPHQKYLIQQGDQLDDSKGYDSYDSSSSITNEVPQQKKIYIMGQDSDNQMLVVPLFPNFAIWTRGQVVLANKQMTIRNQRDVYPYFEQMKTFLKLNRIPPKKIENNSRQLAYYCLRKKNGGGKIIFIDYSVYDGDFFVNYDKILTINYETNRYQLKRCSQLGYLSKIKLIEQDNKNDLLLTLQSNKGNIIIEKTLDQGQKLFLSNAEIMAMSTKIKVTRQKGVLVLQGKGFVFIQNKTGLKDKNILNIIILLLLILITLVTL